MCRLAHGRQSAVMQLPYLVQQTRTRTGTRTLSLNDARTILLGTLFTCTDYHSIVMHQPTIKCPCAFCLPAIILLNLPLSVAQCECGQLRSWNLIIAQPDLGPTLQTWHTYADTAFKHSLFALFLPEHAWLLTFFCLIYASLALKAGLVHLLLTTISWSPQPMRPGIC